MRVLIYFITEADTKFIGSIIVTDISYSEKSIYKKFDPKDTQAFITNFTSPTDIEDLKYFFHEQGGTNLDVLIDEYKEGTEWSVHSGATIGNIVFFMCAKTSWDTRHVGGLRKIAREEGDPALIRFAEDQYKKYKKYAGKILAVGQITDNPYEISPQYYGQRSQWFARIDNIVLFAKPVDISQFNDFVMVSRTNAITKLTPEQTGSLMKIIQRENPDCFR